MTNNDHAAEFAAAFRNALGGGSTASVARRLGWTSPSPAEVAYGPDPVNDGGNPEPPPPVRATDPSQGHGRGERPLSGADQFREILEESIRPRGVLRMGHPDAPFGPLNH
jgi:hypothetical protein